MLNRPVAILTLGLALLAGACASSRALDESMTDMGANAQLKAVLFADRSHDYSDIDITIYEGRLLLTGTMPTEEGRAKLIENAWRAEGVDRIIDEVVIGEKTSFEQGFEDSRIDAALRARLIGDADIRSGDYKIAVSQGVIYLLGAAPDQASLEAAVAIARGIADVEKVVSHVTVRGA